MSADSAPAKVQTASSNEGATTVDPSTITNPEAKSPDAVTGSKAENKPGQKSQNAKNKTRRERPPLPDPLPEKLVQKYPKPSQDDLNKKIAEHEKTIQDSFNKLASMRSGYERKAKVREASKAEFDAARKKLTAGNAGLRELFDAHKDLSNEIKTLRDADIAARAEATSSGGRDVSTHLSGLKTVEDVEQEIRRLERVQQTESVPILEEKKIVNKIAFLNHTGMDIIRERDLANQAEKANKKARVEKRSELEAARKELDKKIDAEKTKVDALKKDVDAVRAKQDAELKKIDEETKSLDREKVKETINSEKAVIRKIREDYQVELDKWYLNERIHVEQIKLQKRKRFEAMQAEREARRKAWEEEQKQYPEPDPYQKEKDMIAGLSVYLHCLLGEPVGKTGTNSLLPKGSAPSLKPEKNVRAVSTVGKRVGKGSLDEQFETLAFSSFMQKKSKGKGKKGRRGSVSLASAGSEKAESDENLKPVSVGLLASFTHLGITPPSKLSEVRGALEAVKKKQEYYESDPPPPEPKEQAAVPKKKNTALKANGKSSVKDITSSGAFPGLNGSSGENEEKGEENSDGRPSFSEITKGSAVAPPAGESFPAMSEGVRQETNAVTPSSAAVTAPL